MTTSGTVLVVDGDVEVGDFVARVLSVSAYRVFRRRNADEAVELLKHCPVDVVLVDVHALETTDLLKTIQLAGLNASVVVMTMSASIDRAWKFVQAGARSFIEKPLRADTLRAQIALATRATRSAAELSESPLRIGRYDIIGQLGRGGMGVVYEGWDAELERVVAIKELRANKQATPENSARYHRRFQLEARTLAQLDHPNIAPIFDFGRRADNGNPFLVMERVAGPSLRSQLSANGPLPEPLVVAVAHQCADALAHAHQRGVIHRDVKPDNLIGHARGRVKLVDFGIVSVQFREIATPGMLVGSPDYMSPEAIRGKSIDFRTDQFALGTTMIELLTGVRPYAADSVQATGLRLVQEPYVPMRNRGCVVSNGLERIIARLQAKLPGDRYESDRTLLEELDALRRAPDPSKFS